MLLGKYKTEKGTISFYETNLKWVLNNYRVPYLKELTLEGNGDLKGHMWHYITHPYDCWRNLESVKIILALHRNKIIGWAWGYHDEHKIRRKFKRVYFTMYFVRPDWRRLGIGTQLNKQIKKCCAKYKRKIIGEKWDSVSEKFFDKLKFFAIN